MKTLMLLLFACSMVGEVYAQEDPGRALRRATRNIAQYNMDPSANLQALEEAVTLIKEVVRDSEYAEDHRAWQTYGTAHGELVNRQVQALVINPEAGVKNPDVITETYIGFDNALKYARRPFETRDAVNMLHGFLPNMNFLANHILQAGDYATAYHAYQAVNSSERIIRANDRIGIFESEEEFRDNRFIAGICAYAADMKMEALQIFDVLREEGYQDPGLYEYLFKVHDDLGNAEVASAILREGRMKFPDDKGLLFAEINEALKHGDLEQLIDKLKEAMEAEPENVTVPTTLGNVYDQLYQDAIDAGDKETAQAHYENARIYIGKALEIDPEHFDAVYMMGALEYNKAAELANEVNELADDYSREGTLRYNAKRDEMMVQFERALPYFEKAERLNSKDSNTLLALREIWARKGDLDKANEYSIKLAAIGGQ